MFLGIHLSEISDKTLREIELTGAQACYIKTLHAISCALSLGLISYWIYSFIRSRIATWRGTFYKKRGFSHTLGATLVFLAAVWCMRYAVGRFVMPLTGHSGFEEGVNSLLHALQTFSMDEDYTSYVSNGKIMMEVLTKGCSNASGWIAAYGVYAFLLNIAAPIAGGALILELITGLFPSLKLWFYSKLLWKERCYFSELNERSLALAKSLRSQKYRIFCKPVIVFTDAYTDKDNEKSAELLAEAKQLGALCIKDDICHARCNRFFKRSFFLMDEVEVDNLQTLANLTNSQNYKTVLRAKIFVFSQSTNHTLVEKQLRERLEKTLGVAEKDMPLIFPIQIYKNIIADLLSDLPLYEPIVHRYKEDRTTDLNVTILGTGYIGTEMFLASCWAGQMHNVRLHFNIISKESESEFLGRIDFISPEIMQSSKPCHPILCYNGEGDTNPPYFSLNYMEGDLKAWDGKDPEARERLDEVLAKTDYCLVALGNDEDNMTVAKELRCRIGKAHMDDGKGRRTLIAYVIYNPCLCELLNTKKHLSPCGGTPCVYSHAIGSLHEQYDIQTVYTSIYELQKKEEELKLTEKERGAQKAKKKPKKQYGVKDNSRRSDIVTKDTTDRGKNSQNYDHWATLSRVIHIKYKLFSMGWIKDSVFDGEEQHKERVSEAYNLFKRLCIGYPPKGAEKVAAEFMEKRDMLAWNERRRWCAFTRSQGYSSTDKCREYFDHCGDHKHMELRLHPCLVESDSASVRRAEDFVFENARKAPTVKLDKLDELSELVIELCDKTDKKLAADKEAEKARKEAALKELDWLGKKRYMREKAKNNKGKKEKKPKNRMEFKVGDYPHQYFGKYLPLCSDTDKDDAIKLLGKSERKVKRMCKKGDLTGAVLYEDIGWLVPKYSLPEKKEKQQSTRQSKQ
ncbi:MAG: hypothetical protein IKK83_05620 [Clostridia bacterium]|nr:hypothetical protein [Clostridia bacterium]